MSLSATLHDQSSKLISAYLRERGQRNAAKRVARWADVDPRTSEAWLAGKCPGFQHFLALVAKFGPAFAELALAPALDSYEARKLDDDLSELEAWIAAEKVRRRHARSGS